MAVSGLEMAQNATMTTWSPEDVDERLKAIMVDIHAAADTPCTLFLAGSSAVCGIKQAHNTAYTCLHLDWINEPP